MAIILIMDPDRSMAERTAEALTRVGHACCWAADFEQAIEHLRWQQPDLVLLDQAMVATAEPALSRQLYSHDRFVALPVVQTSKAPCGKVDQIFPNGNLETILMPFDPRFLVWRVNFALEAQSAQYPAREVQQ